MKRFGTFSLQKQFRKKCNDYYVNVYDLLENLKPYEVSLSKLCNRYKITIPDELKKSNKDSFLIDINTELRCLLEEDGFFEKIRTDNTCNYYGRINHDIAFIIYHNRKDDMYYVDLSVHYEGDVRCNYSDSVIYQFDKESDFFEILIDSYRTDFVKYKGIEYKIISNILSDCVEVYGGSYDTIQILNSSEIYKENIKDMIQGYINDRNKDLQIETVIEIFDMQDKEKMKIVDYDKQYNNMKFYKIEKIGRYDMIVASIDNPTIKIRVKKSDLFEIKE